MSGETNPSPTTVNADSSRGRVDAVTEEKIYEELRDDDRVVMRHQIALNLEGFRAALPEFTARPTTRISVVRRGDSAVCVCNHSEFQWFAASSRPTRGFEQTDIQRL